MFCNYYYYYYLLIITKVYYKVYLLLIITKVQESCPAWRAFTLAVVFLGQHALEHTSVFPVMAGTGKRAKSPSAFAIARLNEHQNTLRFAIKSTGGMGVLRQVIPDPQV